MHVAALTMAWDESLFLPIWARHYGTQVGSDNLYVIDNDSEDLSGLTNKISRIRYPRRGPFDDAARGEFVSKCVEMLLCSYDVVVFSDTDEILCVDPWLAADLPSYFSANNNADAFTAIGMNIHHMIGDEIPLDSSQPILSQRRYGRFVSPMCKTLATRKPIKWTAGFHASNRPHMFGGLYNFHLKWIDLDYMLRRLAKTRAMEWAELKEGQKPQGAHQRISDLQLATSFLNTAKIERKEGELVEEIMPFVNQLQNEIYFNETNQIYSFKREVRSEYLMRIPDRFMCFA